MVVVVVVCTLSGTKKNNNNNGVPEGVVIKYLEGKRCVGSCGLMCEQRHKIKFILSL